MEFKKIIIILSITIIILFGIMMGVSYGWYAYSNAEINITGVTLKNKPTVIFAQTEHIFSNQTMPILDEDKYTHANKNSFTITLGENLQEYETGIEISLKDLAMSDELKIENYKYELLEDGIIVASGNFSEIGSETSLILKPMTLMNPKKYPQTYTYELYIWLSDDQSDQNELMNKVFGAKVNINSAVKK